MAIISRKVLLLRQKQFSFFPADDSWNVVVFLKTPEVTRNQFIANNKLRLPPDGVTAELRTRTQSFLCNVLKFQLVHRPVLSPCPLVTKVRKVELVTLEFELTQENIQLGALAIPSISHAKLILTEIYKVNVTSVLF